MREKINVSEYAGKIIEALPKGILLNTKHTKFNSMVIGWAALVLYGENLRLQYMLGNIAIQKHSLMQRENLRSAFPWKE